MTDPTDQAGVDLLRVVEEAARFHYRVNPSATPFAAVLGPDGRSAIVCAPGGATRPSWEHTRSSESQTTPPAVDLRLLSAVRSVADGISAVAWVHAGAQAGSVEIRSEDKSGRAQRTWSADLAGNDWSREACAGSLWAAQSE